MLLEILRYQRNLACLHRHAGSVFNTCCQIRLRYLKPEHRMDSNRLKGQLGDSINANHERRRNEVQEVDPLAGGFFCLHSGQTYLGFCTRESALADRLDSLFPGITAFSVSIILQDFCVKSNFVRGHIGIPGDFRPRKLI